MINKLYKFILSIVVLYSIFILVFEVENEISEITEVINRWLFSMVFGFDILFNFWNSKNRIKYFYSLWFIVDSISFISIYLNSVFGIVKLLRLIRISKITKGHPSITIFVEEFKKKTDYFLMALFLGLFFLTFGSIAFYITEFANNENINNFGDALWLSYTTMTTIGYGGVKPESVEGKIVGSIIAFLGISFFAIPAGIIISTFNSIYIKEKK